MSSDEFYKHIEADLLEPRRMKQLLIWCGTRTLEEKPSEKPPKKQDKQDLAARTIGTSPLISPFLDEKLKGPAWEIQQQLLKDFSTHSELSDWFSRVCARDINIAMAFTESLS